MNPADEYLEFDNWNSAAKALLAGWKDELARLTARWNLAPVFSLQRSDAIVDFSGEEKTLRVRKCSGGETAISIGGDAAGMSQVSTILGAENASRDVILRLPSQAALRLVSNLPRMPAAQLRGAVAFELERLSPLPPEDLYFDYEAIEVSESLQISLRGARREVVDGAVAAISAAGLKICDIYFGDDPRPADPRAFPVSRHARWRRLWHTHHLLVLGFWCLLSLIVFLSLSYARGAADLDALSEEQAGYAMRDARVARVERDIQAFGRKIEFVNASRNEPLLVMIVRDITQLMPADSWITQLDRDHRRIRLTGFSRAPANLEAAFKQSARFSNVDLVAKGGPPIVGGNASFELSMDIAGGWQ